MTVINEAISNASCTFFGSSGGVVGPGVAASGSLWTISLENVISVLSGDGVTRVTCGVAVAGRNYKRRDKFRRRTTLGSRQNRGRWQNLDMEYYKCLSALARNQPFQWKKR